MVMARDVRCRRRRRLSRVQSVTLVRVKEQKDNIPDRILFLRAFEAHAKSNIRVLYNALHCHCYDGCLVNSSCGYVGHKPGTG